MSYICIAYELTLHKGRAKMMHRGRTEIIGKMRSQGLT